MTQTALKYDVEVDEDGRVELQVPFPSGAHVTASVIREPELRWSKSYRPYSAGTSTS